MKAVLVRPLFYTKNNVDSSGTIPFDINMYTVIYP